MDQVKLSSIVAMAENNVIGKDNDLLWHIPEDFKHFKRTTMGCPMLMGRKTFDSLPGMLKGRTHIIVSRSAENTNTIQEDPSEPKLIYVTSLEDGINTAKEIAAAENAQEAFIIGGGEIYKQTLPLIDRLYLTIVHRDYEGDTSFPEFNREEWSAIREDHHEAEGETPAFTILTLDRK